MNPGLRALLVLALMGMAAWVVVIGLTWAVVVAIGEGVR